MIFIKGEETLLEGNWFSNLEWRDNQTGWKKNQKKIPSRFSSTEKDKERSMLPKLSENRFPDST